MPFFRISGCDPIASYCIIMYFSSIFYHSKSEKVLTEIMAGYIILLKFIKYLHKEYELKRGEKT